MGCDVVVVNARILWVRRLNVLHPVLGEVREQHTIFVELLSQAMTTVDGPALVSHST